MRTVNGGGGWYMLHAKKNEEITTKAKWNMKCLVVQSICR